MNTPIKDSALVYAEVLRFLRSLKTGDAVAVAAVYQAVSIACKHVRNPQQVTDALKSYHKKGLVSRMRDGHNYLYWAKSLSPSTEPVDMSKHAPIQVDVPKVGLCKALGTNAKPEILVAGNSIIINHAKCKIIIEF